MQRLIENQVGERWKTAAIGGEIYPPIQGELFKDNPETVAGAPLQDWDLSVNEARPTWLIVDQIKGYSGSTRENTILAAKGLGYDLEIQNVTHAETIYADSELRVEVSMENIGVAPFYYDNSMWKTYLGIFHEGQLIRKMETSWDMSDLLVDDEAKVFTHVLANPGLGAGEFELAIKLENPMQGGLPVFYATVDKPKTDGWLWPNL